MKAEERKASILLHAKHLFSECGYHNTQISDIIKEAKIARGTLYQYFKNKDDIFITLLEDFLVKWRHLLRKRDFELDFSKISAEDFLRHRIKTTLQFFADDYELCNIVLRMGVGLHDSIEKVIQRLESEIQEIVENEIRFGQRNNNIAGDLDTVLVANLLAGAVLRTSLYYFVKNRDAGKHKSVADLAEKITRLFSPGLFI